MSGADITNPAAVGKTQFPASWSENDVITAVSDVVSNPTSTVNQVTGPAGASLTNAGNPARYKVTGTYNGVDIVVIYEPATGSVISAFPSQ